MEQIIDYIKRAYSPLSIIVYGSYANGTNNLNSDFDALVISSEHEQYHDTSFVNGVQLDVFIYPVSYFKGEYDYNDFIQIFDGKVILDSEDVGLTLQKQILTYLHNRPCKTKAEIQANIDWCTKMFERVKRNDAEGMFRWHWVLIDSLEIFCDMMQHPYLGPKKSLNWMRDNFPTAFDHYQKALSVFSMETLENWISYIKRLNEK